VALIAKLYVASFADILAVFAVEPGLVADKTVFFACTAAGYAESLAVAFGAAVFNRSVPAVKRHRCMSESSLLPECICRFVAVGAGRVCSGSVVRDI